MKQKSAEEIMAASKPRDIFSMNALTLEQEKDEYVERFKPKEYNTIKYFLVTQKVILLYRQALEELEKDEKIEKRTHTTMYFDEDGNQVRASYHYSYDIKIGQMLVTENNVIYTIPPENKEYYKNYIEKTKKFPKFNKDIWESIRYMLPVSTHYMEENGKGVILLNKPCSVMYPLREILDYFEGKIPPEYAASILTRLYNFVCYLELIGINHNGITVDNLFFAPGKTVEEGENYTVEDMRIVGVFGGWFFTTNADEKIKGAPKSVYDIMPEKVKTSGYSSFEVDELSIKMVARELLGDITGKNLTGVPDALVDWVNSSEIARNAYEEFVAWERVRKQAFGKHRFVEMDVSIDYPFNKTGGI